MTTVDEATAEVERMRVAAEAARVSYADTASREWREWATAAVRKLVVDLQPLVTEKMGDQLPAFKQTVTAVIDAGEVQARELFFAVSDPMALAQRVRRGYNPRAVSPSIGEVVTKVSQPFHDLLRTSGYSPDQVKSRRTGASYSSSQFLSDDVTAPKYDTRSEFADAIDMLGRSLHALEDAKTAAARATVGDLWDGA